MASSGSRQASKVTSFNPSGEDTRDEELQKQRAYLWAQWPPRPDGVFFGHSVLRQYEQCFESLLLSCGGELFVRWKDMKRFIENGKQSTGVREIVEKIFGGEFLRVTDPSITIRI